MSILDVFRRPQPEPAIHETATATEAAALAVNRVLEAAGMTYQDLLLFRDMQGFERMGEGAHRADEMREPSRRALVGRSRSYWRFEPLAYRSIALWTEFSFGDGWSISSDDTAMQQIIADTWQARHNKRQLSHEGLRRSSDALLVDGERWFIYFVAPDGREVKVRAPDPLQIDDVLTNPDDDDEIWYVRRRWTGDDGRQHVRWYRHWDYTGKDRHPRISKGAPGIQGIEDVNTTPVPRAWISHLAINTFGHRGYPLLTPSLDWIREHREVLADRAAMIHARAQVAWKGRVKGGQKSVDALTNAFASPDPADLSTGYRATRARTFVHNDGADLEAMTTPSDGASAQQDQRSIRSMALTGPGVPEHLTGDSSNANLATAKATERPMEMQFRSYQQVWIDYYIDMLAHMARWRGIKAPGPVEIDPPNILARDVAAMLMAAAALLREAPVLAQSPEVIAMLLSDLGLEDVGAAMETLIPLMAAQPDPEMGAALEALREAIARAA